MTLARIIEEPLRAKGGLTSQQRRTLVRRLAGETGLAASQLDRYPRELSGGQRQRVGLARALATSPALIVADEPVSALDVSVRSQILNLMTALQAEHQLSYLMVSHDLTVIHYLADYIGGDVPGQDRRVQPPRLAVPRARPPLHQGAHRRGPPADPRPGRPDLIHPRRAALGLGAAVRLPLPHPVPRGRRAVRRTGAAAARLRARPPRRLPLPPDRARGGGHAAAAGTQAENREAAS